MDTEILPVNSRSIEAAKKILLGGGVIGMPTETVYGLAAIATSSDAVKKIFEIKGRPTDNPLIAHVHKDFDLERLVKIEYGYVFDLLNAYSPGPMTLVMYGTGAVCAEAVCGGDTLAVRIPSHEGCQRLLRAVDLPVAAPSANVSKHTSPTSAEHVYDDLNGKIPLILDGGKCSGGIESTVLDCTGKYPRILRAGLVTREMVEKVAGRCDIAAHAEGDKVRSPGVKYRHYRPKCQTALYEADGVSEAAARYDEEQRKGNSPYIMCSDEAAKAFGDRNILPLGKSGEEIARNLYARLLEGEKKAGIIIAVAMPREDGVYLGIMNRLRKSCG